MLDFASLAAQMEKMLDEGRIRPDALPLAIEAATGICARCDERGDFNALIESARDGNRVPERWHPARLLDGGLLCGTKAMPDALSSYLVVASDGSQVYPDAHQIADCYLLHISGIALRYGMVRNDAPDNARMAQQQEAQQQEAQQQDGMDSIASSRSIFDDSPHMSTHAQAETIELNVEEVDSALMRATPYFGHGASDDAWQEAARLGGGAANREMVDARRHVAELDELASLLESAPPDLPSVGLCDGIFDLRVSSQQPWRALAHQENHRALDVLRQCGQPIGGFIATSRATDVVTALRVVLRELARESRAKREDSPSETRPSRDENESRGNQSGINVVDARPDELRDSEPRFAKRHFDEVGDGPERDGELHSDQTHSSETRDGETRQEVGDAMSDVGLFNREVDEALSILVDVRLFDGLLRAGERSATFVAGRGANQSSANRRNSHRGDADREDAAFPGRGMSTHAGDSSEGARHQTCFFYLKSGAGEVARLEFPVWVAQRADWLDRLHSVVLAQIERGAGYPVALMEAHEHAVVRASERELFYQLLEEMMTARGLKPHRSAKALSKSRPLV